MWRALRHAAAARSRQNGTPHVRGRTERRTFAAERNAARSRQMWLTQARQTRIVIVRLLKDGFGKSDKKKKKPNHSDLSYSTPKEQPTGQRYRIKILPCSAP
jgi:hypothetical protein